MFLETREIILFKQLETKALISLFSSAAELHLCFSRCFTANLTLSKYLGLMPDFHFSSSWGAYR